MAVPPPTYFLLVGLTLLAWPFVLRRAYDKAARNVGRRLLVGLLLFEVSLIVLFYSRVACALGIVASAACLASSGTSRRTAALAAVPSAVAGLIFVLQPAPGAFVTYFAFSLPAALLVALATALTHWLRWSTTTSSLVGSAAVLAVAAFVPLSAFSLSFLVLFEVAHLAFLIVALFGITWLISRGAALRDAARSHAPVEFEGYPGALLGARTVVALASGVVAVVGGLAVAWQATLDEAPLATALGFVQVSVGGLLAAGGAMALAVAFTNLTSQMARRAYFTQPWSGRSVDLPTNAFVRDGAWPTTKDLQAFSNHVAAAGARTGVLRVTSRTFGDSLDEAAQTYLDQQTGPVRIHVAVQEGPDLFLVPPIQPGESDL